jgi:hypothetical protein
VRFGGQWPAPALALACVLLALFVSASCGAMVLELPYEEPIVDAGPPVRRLLRAEAGTPEAGVSPP